MPEQPARRSADDNRPTLSQALKPCRKVRPLPNHSMLPQSAPATGVTHDHQTSGDPNPNRKRFPGRRLETCHRSKYLKPSPHGSLSIVFVREWIAEIRQYPVPSELGQEAVIGSSDTSAGGMVGI